MKLHKVPSVFHLVEFAHVAPETVAGRAIVPMQLFHHSGKSADSDNRIFFVSGFQGPTKHDTHVSGLLQKALMKSLFSPLADVWMTPVVNPSSDPKNSWMNHKGTNMAQIATEDSLESTTLLRWIGSARPKAVVSISVGATAGIHAIGAPAQVTQRLVDMIEKPLLNAAEERPLSGLSQWCSDNNIIWLEFVLDEGKKTFEEIRDTDWRRHFGPAIKWLLEGERFNPPKEEDLSLEHLIVPALEMPPEFAHLV